MDEKDIRQYNPLVLAFVGDAAYGLLVKEYVASKEVKVNDLQKHTTKFVSAKAQAKYVEYFLENNIYTEKELEYYKRGRNCKSHGAPKNTDVVTYHVSTGFEAVWGYLYLEQNWDRIEQLWTIIRTIEGE